MDEKVLLDIREERGAKSESSGENTKTIEYTIAECRRVVRDSARLYRNLEDTAKREEIKRIIVSYIMGITYLVKDYTTEDNKLDTSKLVDKVVEDITDYSILSEPINDPAINEIRSNGREIKIEKDGRAQDLKDKYGNIVRFESVEQQEIVIRRLLGDVKLTPKDAIVNSRTVEGYRVAAIHSSALSSDTEETDEKKYHAFVLRKFKKIKLQLSDIVTGPGQTMSDSMAKLLKIGIKGGSSIIFAGPTASGKTTLMQAALWSVPDNARTLLIQNPSEIDLRRKDSFGRVVNDVIHMEAREIENAVPTDPTMENCMMHALRLSPTNICIGEMRTNKEIELAVTIQGAGHPVYASTHAKNSMGAFMRVLRGYMASTNETIETALPNLVDQMDFIVIQRIMNDGYRRVLEIAEIVGVDPANPNRPKLNYLYMFEPTTVDREEDGTIKRINGYHQRLGQLSKSRAREFKLSGIDIEDLQFILNEVNENEKETYTGKNLDIK